MNSLARELFLFIMLLCGIGALRAQSDGPSTYEGPYRLDEFEGSATYEYRVRRRDTLRTGDFNFRGLNARSLLSGMDRPFGFTGQYEDDTPVGEWTLTFGEYKLGGAAELANGKYHLAVDGARHLATGSLRAGAPDSVWTQTVHRIEASDTTEVLLRSEVRFDRGTARQSFRLESGPRVLLGRVQRDGVAEDEWTLYDDLETAQQWRFDDGQLRSIVRNGDTLATFPLLSGRTEEVDLDARYLNWLGLQLRLQGAGATLAGNPVVELLTRNAEAYARTFAAIRALGGDAGWPLFRVRLPVDPLSRRELADLEAIDEQLRHIDTLSRSVLTNTALSVVENEDPQIAALRTAVTDVRDSILAPVREIRNSYQAELLPYLDRSAYLATLWGGNGPSALEGVLAVTTKARQRVDSIRTVLGEKSNTRERQRAITALDEQLEREYFLLDSLLGANLTAVPERYGLEAIRSLAASEMRSYATAEDQLDRERRAQELIRCVENLNALALGLLRLPEREVAVRAAYTNEVWNNFTATVMEEIVKKRVYRAYDEILIPYYLEQVRTGLSCAGAVPLAESLDELHQRMLELRDEDTDELESRLRRADEPGRVLQLITESVTQ